MLAGRRCSLQAIAAAPQRMRPAFCARHSRCQQVRASRRNRSPAGDGPASGAPPSRRGGRTATRANGAPCQRSPSDGPGPRPGLIPDSDSSSVELFHSVLRSQVGSVRAPTEAPEDPGREALRAPSSDFRRPGYGLRDHRCGCPNRALARSTTAHQPPGARRVAAPFRRKEHRVDPRVRAGPPCRVAMEKQ